MKRITQHPIHALAVLLLMLTAFMGACKKDKTGQPVVDFKINSYYPNSGNTGTLVTIVGTGFDTDLSKYSATIVGKPAEVVSATSGYIVLMVPAGTGSGKIELRYGNDTRTVGNYIYQNLTVGKISPGRGPIGTNIRISGEGFSDPKQQATVTINGNAANIISLTDTLIIVTVPEKTSTGPVLVKVGDKSSTGPVFKVQAIFEIAPKTGGKGTKIALNGSGFDTDVAKNTVTVGGKVAQVLNATENQLIVQAPDGVQTGKVNLRIEDSNIEGPVFTVVAAPTISQVTPLSGPAGTEITITGTGYSSVAGENKVTINGKDAVVKSATATALNVTVPVNTGTGKVQLSVNDQVVDGPIYTEQAVGIASFSPDNGNAGTVVTLTGVGFSATPAGNLVTFNGVAAQVTAATATQLTVIVPQGVSSGFIKVKVNGVEAVSPKVFQTAGVISITTSLPYNTATSFCAGLNGEFYVVYRSLNVIFKVAPDGTASLYAGSPNGSSGDTEGIGTAGRFTAPVGIVCDKQGNLFVAETKGNVKKISPNGMVTMYKAGASPSGASGLAIDSKDNLYIGARSNSFNGFVLITAAGEVQYNWDLYLDPENRMGVVSTTEVYASDVNSTGRYALGDGSANYNFIGDGFTPGYADGSYTSARFGMVGNAVWVKSKGLVLVCDPDNNALRSINTTTKTVGTIIKTTKGFRDGSFNDALFGDITDVNIGPNGEIYILDKTNKAIRKITF